MSDNNITFTEYAISSVANQDAVLPVQPMLYSYPNPFNPALGSLNIAFSAPKKELTSLDVYNSKGQLVRHLNTDSPAGAGSVFSSTWDGSTDNLSPAVNGIYLLKLQYGSRCVSRKIIIVR
jgi:hypothetical protein